MNEAPQRYSERRALIAQKLEPLFTVSSLTPTNTSATFEPEIFDNSLMCSWADPQTLTTRTLFVYVHRVPDGSAKAADVRQMIEDETLPTDEGQPPEAYEIHGQRAGEHVFVLNYLGRLTAIANDCVVSIMPSGFSIPLADTANAALDIARTVGCSAYLNDFQPPVLDTSKVSGVWSTADGSTYDPQTPQQE
ncbi:hypothetical protein ACPCIR_21780 [Mycobacterium sp. NPDC051198]